VSAPERIATALARSLLFKNINDGATDPSHKENCPPLCADRDLSPPDGAFFCSQLHGISVIISLAKQYLTFIIVKG